MNDYDNARVRADMIFGQLTPEEMEIYRRQDFFDPRTSLINALIESELEKQFPGEHNNQLSFGGGSSEDTDIEREMAHPAYLDKHHKLHAAQVAKVERMFARKYSK